MTFLKAFEGIKFDQKVVNGHCQKHGDFQDVFHYMNGFSPQKMPECPICRRERDEAEEKAAQERKMKERIEELMLLKNIPESFMEVGFNTFMPQSDDQKEVLESALRYVANWEKIKKEGFGILFYGSCGTGKTHLAVSILKALLEVKSLYVQIPDLLQEIRSTWNSSAKSTPSEVIAKYRNIDLLVIDEIGVQAGTDNEMNLLFSILDHRIANKKPTIFITNLDATELPNYLGNRTVDRIKSVCKPLLLVGKSMRKASWQGVF